jgi:hypothetical protein
MILRTPLSLLIFTLFNSSKVNERRLKRDKDWEIGGDRKGAANNGKTTTTEFKMTTSETIFNNRQFISGFEECQSLEEVQDLLYDLKLDLSDLEFEEVMASVANLGFSI